MNRAYIGNMQVASKYPYIVYGSVRGLVSNHRSVVNATFSLARDVSGCHQQGGYSDARIYKFSAGKWVECETAYGEPLSDYPIRYDTDRRMAYDGEGCEVGSLTLREAREQYGSAKYERESDTITVGE